MSDPEETPAQAMERINKEIAQLRRLRAHIPMLILEPYVEEATAHIKEVAARMMVTPTIPATVAITASREEQQAATQPAAPAEAPAEVPAPGTVVTYQPPGEAGFAAMALYHIAVTRPKSPPEYEVVILTEDGRLLTVKPSMLRPGRPVAAAAAALKISSGQRVKIRTTGKTGYVSEVADATAVVGLDEGGFITAPIADLEPL